MKTLKPILVLLAVLCCAVNSNAQVFWTEGFDGLPCVAGSGCDPSIVNWNVASLGGEGANANKWYISDQEGGVTPPGCGIGGNNNQTLHVGNISTSAAAFLFCPNGDCGAAYDDSGAGELTNKRAESPVIDCSGQSNITVDFNYIENGEGNGDNATFLYFDGTSWTTLDNIAKSTGGCAPQGQWTSATTISLPASADNNPNVQIGFLWINNGNGAASDPSFAVDDIVLTSNPTLPITLLSFDVKEKNGLAELNWTTASEINSQRFDIEKSENGNLFKTIGSINAAEYSDEKLQYQFLDKRTSLHTAYYRVKLVDNDGAYAYSKIQSFEPDQSALELYPNPSQKVVHIKSSNEIESITIYSAGGQIVRSQKKINKGMCSFYDLPGGFYVAFIITSKSTIRKPFIVQ